LREACLQVVEVEKMMLLINPQRFVSEEMEKLGDDMVPDEDDESQTELDCN
jgi:hypothetical protein